MGMKKMRSSPRERTPKQGSTKLLNLRIEKKEEWHVFAMPFTS